MSCSLRLRAGAAGCQSRRRCRVVPCAGCRRGDRPARARRCASTRASTRARSSSVPQYVCDDLAAELHVELLVGDDPVEGLLHVLRQAGSDLEEGLAGTELAGEVVGGDPLDGVGTRRVPDVDPLLPLRLGLPVVERGDRHGGRGRACSTRSGRLVLDLLREQDQGVVLGGVGQPAADELARAQLVVRLEREPLDELVLGQRAVEEGRRLGIGERRPFGVDVTDERFPVVDGLHQPTRSWRTFARRSNNSSVAA